jgi:hypothetical protein
VAAWGTPKAGKLGQWAGLALLLIVWGLFFVILYTGWHA